MSIILEFPIRPSLGETLLIRIHGDDFSNDFDRFDFCCVQHELTGGNGVSLEVA